MKVLLVLGCKVIRSPDDRRYVPGPILKLRLEKAVETYLEIGYRCIIIVSGGSTKERATTESTVMAQYLIERGVPKYKIFEENQAKNSIEHCLFTFKLLSSMEGQLTYQEVMSSNPNCNYYGAEEFGEITKFNSLTVVSSNFHLPRVKRIYNHFNKARFELEFVSSETPLELLSECLKKENAVDIDRSLALHHQ